MPRLSKADAFQAVSATADLLKEIAGPDGRLAKAEVKKFVARKEKAMASRAGVGATPSAYDAVERFAAFLSKRDSGGIVTLENIDRGVAFAKEKMIAKYDKNNNGLSASEIKLMSYTAKAFIDLANEMKANGYELDDL